MPNIKLGPDFNKMACLCCGDIYKTGGEPCICKVTSPWWQNQHGEAACDLHRVEKFSLKSLKEIHRERELAAQDEMLAAKKAIEEARHPKVLEEAESWSN